MRADSSRFYSPSVYFKIARTPPFPGASGSIKKRACMLSAYDADLLPLPGMKGTRNAGNESNSLSFETREIVLMGEFLERK